MVLGLRADVLLNEVEVAAVQVEKEVPVRSQQGPVFAQGQLDVVEGLEEVVDPRMLVEKLAREGGAAPRDGQEQDVLPGGPGGRGPVVAEASPPGVLEKTVLFGEDKV